MKGLREAGAMLALAAVSALVASPPVASALAGGKAVFAADRLLALAGTHAAMAGAAAAIAGFIGVAGGVAVTREGGRPLRPLADTLVAASQAVPPVVVVALAFPALGFGAAPTVLALLIYCVMPVLRGTVGALDGAASGPTDAASAMGMTARQVLVEVELPLALPAILTGLRIALVLAVATAAVGALAGASTLGTPIILGLQNQNEVYILQGAAATAALAFAAEAAMLLVAGVSAPAGLAERRSLSPEWARDTLPAPRS